MSTTNTPRPRRATRWTPLEVLLIIVSAFMIVFPLFAEATRWISPPPAPAANRQQGEPLRVTATSTPDTGAPTDTGVPTSSVPTSSVPTSSVPTSSVPTSSVPTSSVPTSSVPTSSVPTASTPPMGAKLLTVTKSASVSAAAPGEEYFYTISAFTGSATAEPVQVSDQVDPKLEVLGATASNGTCTTAQTVTCALNATSAGVLMTIRVRGRTTAVGTQIANSAAGIITSGANKDITDGSETVYVSIEGTPINATATRTAVVATSAPGQPTAIPGTVLPSATGGPNPPPATTAPTPAPAATTVPNPPSNDGGANQPAAPAEQPSPTTPALGAPPPPIEVVAPPTPGNVGSPPPTVATRPTRPQQATSRPAGQVRTTTPATQPTVTPTSQAQTQAVGTPTSTLTVPTPDTGLYFRMASDWGSAYPEQKVNYVIAVRNTRATGAVNYTNLRIASDLPANLEVVSAKSDRGGDPAVSGNSVVLKLATLAPGEGAEIVIETKVRKNVSAGTTIVSQSSLTADGLSIQNYSNVVALLVVGAPPQQATATTIAPSATTAPAASPSATNAVAPSVISASATSAPTATRSPSAVATATIRAGSGPSGGGTPTLPNTSTGVPLFGLALLGMTMVVRTVRLHRSQTRV